MNIQLIKYVNQNLPDSIKRILAYPIRNKLIKNEIFLNQIDELTMFNTLIQEKKEYIQMKKLKEMLVYSYENVPYYKQLFDDYKLDAYTFQKKEELKKLPILSKKIVMDNIERFLSKENMEFYKSYTGGTTGKALPLFLSKDSIYAEKAFIYNYWSNLGYNFKKSRLVTFRGIEFEKNKIFKYNPVYNEIILSPFSLNSDKINEYIEIINKFKPNYIHGYPSAIYNFCKIINNENRKLKNQIKGVFFISENVELYIRKYIEQTFKCKSLSFYGHSERAVFAEEFNGEYNFNDLYCYFELLQTKNNNMEFDIITTGLVNKKLPLIRYKTDDIAKVKNKKIYIEGHRVTECLIGKNDEKISMAAVNFHSDEFLKVQDYQFEQFERGKAILRIIGNNISDTDIKKITDIVNIKLGEVVAIEILKAKQVILTDKGKYKMIIQHINQ
jgi:phenylacetate-CoA ligase